MLQLQPSVMLQIVYTFQFSLRLLPLYLNSKLVLKFFVGVVFPCNPEVTGLHACQVVRIVDAFIIVSPPPPLTVSCEMSLLWIFCENYSNFCKYKKIL